MVRARERVSDHRRMSVTLQKRTASDPGAGTRLRGGQRTAGSADHRATIGLRVGSSDLVAHWLWGLSKAEKGLVKGYLATVTGLSRSQLTCLVGHSTWPPCADRRLPAASSTFAQRVYTAMPGPMAAWGEVDRRDIAGLEEAEGLGEFRPERRHEFSACCGRCVGCENDAPTGVPIPLPDRSKRRAMNAVVHPAFSLSGA